MWTEAQYVAASERADDLAYSGRHDEAHAVLEEALEHARAAADEGFVLFFEGELAAFHGNREKALELEQRANAVRPDCHMILRRIGVDLAWLTG